MSPLKIAIADDHRLVRDGLIKVLDSLGFSVHYQCENGSEIVEYCKNHPVDIVLMDITMPVMNGFEATARLREINPDVKVIALSMLDDDNSLIRMFQAGAKSYVLKGASAVELKNAIDGVAANGFYASDGVSGRLIRSITSSGEGAPGDQIRSLNQRELDFLGYVCSDLTYKEIADKMCVSPRSIDGYRDNLFVKLEVKSRVGLCLFAVKNKIVEL